MRSTPISLKIRNTVLYYILCHNKVRLVQGSNICSKGLPGQKESIKALRQFGKSGQDARST